MALPEHSVPPLRIAPPEQIVVTTDEVVCDGVPPAGAVGAASIPAALGHPRVYLKIGHEGFVDCPYCDRRFRLAGTLEASPGAAALPGGGAAHATEIVPGAEIAAHAARH